MKISANTDVTEMLERTPGAARALEWNGVNLEDDDLDGHTVATLAEWLGMDLVDLLLDIQDIQDLDDDEDDREEEDDADEPADLEEDAWDGQITSSNHAGGW